MKKFILMAAAAITAASFTSCKEDTQPRLDKPTEFVLNRPAMADQLYVMTPESSITFTVSQPDYGVGCTPNYEVEIAKTEEDFAKGTYDASKPEKGGYAVVEGITTDARITLPSEMFCMAFCNIYGYTTEQNFSADPKPVYVRVRAWVPNAEYSEIHSNIIKLDAVQPYFAVKLPDLIWLIGKPEGWTAPAPGYPEAGPWTLAETEPGSLVYTGTFEIPAGEFAFRFYDKFDADEPWEWYSIGAQNEDATVQISMTNGVYEGDCTYDFSTKGTGKGGWEIPGFEGGTVDMTVNLNTKTVRFSMAQ